VDNVFIIIIIIIIKNMVQT